MGLKEPGQIFVQTLKILEIAFRRLERKVSPPKWRPWKSGFVFRFAEKTVQQAIIQKLARTISGLHAIELLLDEGLFQEQRMVQRVLDEIEEDVVFLSLGVIHNDVTALHQEYNGIRGDGV
jgi:hypothetical protein